MRILVVEDDAPMAEFLRHGLGLEKFSVQMVADGREAQRLACDLPFDLLLLDLNLPGASGLDVLRNVRCAMPDLPVLIVSGAGSVEERVLGLDAGADDYLAKPFIFAELNARIRAVLRRGRRPAGSLLKVEDLELDRLLHAVRRAGHPIELSPKEFALLQFLMSHPGQPVARSAILEQVWHLRGDTLTNVVDVYVNYLRRKIDIKSGQSLIHTIRRLGYQIGVTQD
ncbi:MAG: response regulator transcription factor [Candidatus Acidiferrum sp.]